MNFRDDSVYFIAEIGLNHNGIVHLAKTLIDIAINAGCGAAKFQKRDVESMFVAQILDQEFARFPELGGTMRAVREGLELSKEEYRSLRNFCRGRIDFMVTPFDIPSVEFLDDLDIDAYKIASHSATDIPMLEAVARRGKPVVASVGMATQREVDRMVEVFKNVDLTLLHCVSQYPTQTDNANLGMIGELKKYGRRVGYSDHEDGINIAPVAVALGAEVIEKHITLDKDMQGFDHKMSIEPTQLAQCIRQLNAVKSALRDTGPKTIKPHELIMYDNRRGSLYAGCDIKKGSTLTRDMVRVKAPLRGLTPRFASMIDGAKALYDLKEDDPITFGVIDFPQ